MTRAAVVLDVEGTARALAELRARGLYVTPTGPDRIRIGPPDLLDDEILRWARGVKPELLRILTTRRAWSCVRCDRFRFRLPTVCYWCRRAEGSPGHA